MIEQHGGLRCEERRLAQIATRQRPVCCGEKADAERKERIEMEVGLTVRLPEVAPFAGAPEVVAVAAPQQRTLGAGKPEERRRVSLHKAGRVDIDIGIGHVAVSGR